jgi:3-oxoacyl-[acyl-carrier-protein] synthase II
VTAPKSYFGYLGAGGGAVEMAASVLAFEHGQIPPTLNYEQPDPACPIRVIHGEASPLGQPVALILNQSATGHTAALVIAAP